MRAGDHVYHAPSEEKWVLGRVTDENVYPFGWPRSRAERKDCTVLYECTDAEHAEASAEAERLSW